MSRFALIGATVFGFALLLAYGWAEGRWTGRWQQSNASKVAASRLKHIPLTVGSWVSADGDFDERQMTLAELDGFLHRIYADETTGDTVQVLVLCGRPGPVSLHTPDVCYRGLGFHPTSAPARKLLTDSVPNGSAECWMADFEKSTPLGNEYLRIGWTWLASDGWHAADQPRLEFAQEPALYKVYLIHRVTKLGIPWKEDSIPRLSQVLLPVLTNQLFPDASPTVDATSQTED